MELIEYIPDQIWLKSYPVHYAGCDFTARMSVIRLDDTRLMLHSPCEIDAATESAICSLGEVACIVAPGSYHYFYVSSAQEAFPDAETYICPGIERKRPDIEFDWLLGNRPPEIWHGVLDQVLVRGTKFIWEVAFLHQQSRTLLLVDLIENVTDQTPNVDWQLKLWWKVVMHMWNRAAPAPEYQLGWGDKRVVKECLNRVLNWDFERIIIAHGDNIESNAEAVAREAWKVPLSHSAS